MSFSAIRATRTQKPHACQVSCCCASPPWRASRCRGGRQEHSKAFSKAGGSQHAAPLKVLLKLLDDKEESQGGILLSKALCIDDKWPRCGC